MKIELSVTEKKLILDALRFARHDDDNRLSDETGLSPGEIATQREEKKVILSRYDRMIKRLKHPNLKEIVREKLKRN